MSASWIQTIPGWLTPHEGICLRKAASYVSQLHGDVVEIGSFQGKSTIYLAEFASHVTAIDPHKGVVSGGILSATYKQYLSNIKRAHVEKRITTLVATSKNASKKWKTPITLLFIDGLHDEAHAREDYELWSKFVIPGGVVAMHDAFCGWEGANIVAMKHIVRGREYAEVGVVGSIIYGIKGKSSATQRIIKLFRMQCIDLCHKIYYNDLLPKRIRFILVHKLLRITLLNRFSSIG
jgi:predicted O-methyltransferase YrrM